MKLYGVLVLFVTFSVASGLRCYTCVTSDPSACTNIETCPDGFDRCASVKIPESITSYLSILLRSFLALKGLITKSCMPSAGCISPIKCCDKDLCNAVPTGPGVFLLLMSSALIMLFI
uniref:UPAR/Ly6 domain-containing protein n=1 Tax=Poecilia mexicana TaxID=48701 RepID=A0A3B3Y698_9TELE